MDDDFVAKGFWSYARTDDDRERGRIVRLASLIRDEFQTLTGASIEIFVDRDDVRWGQNFRDRIDDSLRQTTFFIPVLTSTFFLRDECRREMREFVATARTLGQEELLLSIRYSPISDLTEDSTDELKAIAAKMQYEPWEDLRLVDEDSAAYRRGVNRLAGRLVELTTELQNRPVVSVGDAMSPASRDPLSLDSPGPTSSDEATEDLDSPGYFEHMAEFGPATSEWMNAIGGFPDSLQEFNRLMSAAGTKMSTTESKPNPFAARIVILRSLAKDLDGPVAKIESLSKEYASGLLRLDPIIQAVLTALPLTNDPDEIRSATASVRGLILAARAAMEGVSGAASAAKRYEGMSRDLRPLLRRFQVAMRNVLDGQATLEAWLPLIEKAEELAAEGDDGYGEGVALDLK